MSLRDDFGWPWWVAVVFIVGVLGYAFFELSAGDSELDDLGFAGAEDVSGADVRRRSPSSLVRGGPLGVDGRSGDDFSDSITDDGNEVSPPTHRVTGKITVLDSSGARHDCRGGEFEVTVHSSDDENTVQCKIYGGTWAAELPLGDSVSFDDASIDGRRASLPTAKRPFPQSGNLDLEFEWLDGFLVYVTGKESKEPLLNVYITRTWDRSIEHPGIDGRNRAEIESSLSPIPIDGVSEQTFFAIGAPGYGWESLELRPGAPETIRLELVPASQLNITFTGPKQPRATKLRLFRLTAADTSMNPSPKSRTKAPLFEMDLGNKRYVRIRGLRPGVYEVRAEVGYWLSKPLVVAQGTSTLESDVVSELTLEVNPDVSKLSEVPLSGSLVCHPDWHLNGKIQLKIYPNEGRTPDHGETINPTLVPMPNGENEWSWDAGSVLPGRYYGSIEPMQTHIEFDVPKSGLNNLVLNVGPPIKCLVVLRDAQSGKTIKGGEIRWFGRPPIGAGLRSLSIAKFNTESGGHQFLSPAGEVTISTSVKGYQRVSQRITVKAPTTTIALALRSSQGVHIETIYKGRRVNLGWRFKVALEPVAGTPRSKFVSQSSNLSLGKSFFRDPGTYRLKFPKIKGYEQIPDREVTIVAGQMTSLKIEVKSESSDG